jgi:hypothetical protein
MWMHRLKIGIMTRLLQTIAIAILVLIFGIICGGIGFLLVNRKKDT